MLRTKKFLLVMTTLMGTAVGMAQTDPAAQSTPPTTTNLRVPLLDKELIFSDKHFVTMLAQGNAYELAAAQIALAKSSRSEVQTYAQIMVSDHTQMGAMLQATVQQIDPAFPIPNAPSPKHQRMLEELSAATTNFDVVYKAQMLMSHAETLNLLQSFQMNGYGHPLLKALAQTAEPVVTMHLQMAQLLP
ncbi:DUF4142 domain-containing protein [Deinococcus misasensis]|uniref:DUF4142 domain-containing protein n=1 Tax=Deinococcus misasensis TaxID=392413 RepID=UPI00068B4890|nr:DUF4142 domain-containing protein [Deinococcus misasensis]